jgi:hypothetical protein
MLLVPENARRQELELHRPAVVDEQVHVGSLFPTLMARM